MNLAPGAVRETAYAKLNLALHVRARTADGYHRIETLFAFAEDGDTLLCEPAEELTLAIEGPLAAGLPSADRNLVRKAALALRDHLGIGQGARLTLTKNLPVASGIGGGSADAAAALRGLARLWEADMGEAGLAAIARSLGADVPACLESRTFIGRGRGDELRSLDAPALSGLPLLLVNPGVPIPTPEVFAGWDGEDRGPLTLSEPATLDSSWSNDLAAPAIMRVPVIAALLESLESCPGAQFVRMSGSGATCFSMFTDPIARDEAAEKLRSEYPDWWVWTSRLR